MLNTKENVLDVINKLGDIEFQKDVWRNGKYWNRVTDFGEAVNTLGDYHFFDDVEKNIMGLSESELKIVKEYISSLFEYEEVEDVFTDPIWLAIVSQSKLIYQILSGKVYPDPSRIL